MKNFEATQGRLDRAKREGDSPRSADLSGAFAFAAGLAGVLFATPHIALCARTTFALATAGPFGLGAAVGELIAILLWAMLPVVSAALAGGSASLLQSGGLRAAAISLKFERLSPVEGFKRMLSREAALNAARAAIAVACAAALLTPAIGRFLAAGGTLGSTQALADVAWSSALQCAMLIALLGGLFGGVDFAMVHARWRKKLRMSFDEVRRDHKEHDGDPVARSRRRALHRDISRNSLKRLKDAAFVLVNPTHIAIALEYRPPEVSVPRLLLKAADELAQQVREAALDLKIPVIENVALARSLYARSRAGDVIPKESYVAIAEIVAALAKSGVLDP